MGDKPSLLFSQFDRATEGKDNTALRAGTVVFNDQFQGGVSKLFSAGRNTRQHNFNEFLFHPWG